MTLLNLNKRNSEVSVLVQVSAEDKDLTFPVHKPLAPFDELRDQHRWLFHSRFQFEQVGTRGGLLWLFRAVDTKVQPALAVFTAGYIGVGCQMSCVLDLSC